MPHELEQQSRMDLEPAASDTVREVAAQVLETMFFTEAELAPCGHAWLGPASCARIRFEGSHSGEMLLGVSAEATDPIAASFLGLDPMELTAAQRGQVIQELSNILCGAHAQPFVAGIETGALLSRVDALDEWPGEGLLHRCFTIPEGMLAISIRLSPVAQPPPPAEGSQ